MHAIRWVLVISWLMLIVSLFYDPFSVMLTDARSVWSPLSDSLLLYVNDPNLCVKVQGECLQLTPYPIATRIFWGIVVPSAVMLVLVFGHDTWRRICPLYFFSQIPRTLGIKPLLKIDNNRWLQRNHFYLQFALFFIGLNARILFVNSARLVFGLFLILVLLSALMMVLLYGGRSWCHYVCPFGMVQMVFTGPRGLLSAPAHTTPPRTLTQSMCRSVERSSGQTQSACISCKSPCMDIDSEKSYWEHLHRPGRRLVQYGYLGMVVGYFLYYRLYAGNFDYYFSGAWTHEPNQLGNLFKPGFYLFDSPIPIPKLIASPLTMGACVIISLALCTWVEKSYRGYLKCKNPYINPDVGLHRIFTLVTFIAFNAFFVYGGRPEILRLHIAWQFLFQGVVVLVSSLWLVRTWGRNPERYVRESLADKLRRQLNRLPMDLSQYLEGRSLNQLQADELYVLAKTLTGMGEQTRLQLYRDVLQEAMQARQVSSASSLQMLRQLRQNLAISESQHYQVLEEIGRDRQLHPLAYPLITEPHHVARTQLRIDADDESDCHPGAKRTQLR